jgi:putative ABC transport system substrate-binding protein
MQRRQFFALLLGGAAAVWPFAAHSQQMRRVGVLMNSAATDPIRQGYVAAFRKALGQLGWVEGQNIRIDMRWNASDASLARIYAAQLIGLQPDAILSASSTNLRILQQATSTIPVVFVQVSDPVAQGFVSNLMHPGGNVTGFSAFDFSVGGKWVDLLKQIKPDLDRIIVVFDPSTAPQTRFFMRSIESAAQSLNMKVVAGPVRNLEEVETKIQDFARQPNGGVVFPTGGLLNAHSKSVAEIVSRYRLPSIGALAAFVRHGGLMYYGYTEETAEQYRQAASYIDRILKGATAGELPVQLATKYALVLNMRAAKALGISVPLALLGLADQVIE